MEGFVSLNDIDGKDIFVKLKGDASKKLKQKIKEYGIATISKKIKNSDRIIRHWLTDKTFIRYDILKELSNLLGIENIENRIQCIRGKHGSLINKPILPFDFTTITGARFIASILGDGTLSKDYEVYYSNSDTDLIKGFVKDSRIIFGDVKINIRKKSDKQAVNIVSLPLICGKILAGTGLSAGRKVSINQRIPDFIFKLDENKKWHFLSQIFDDEGTVNLKAKYIRIKLAIESRHKEFHLIKGLAELFNSLGIKTAIYNSGYYNSTRGPSRTQWSIQINGSLKLKEIYRNFKLRHKPKQKKFNQMLNSFKLEMFPRNEFQDIYLSKMTLIEKEKGFFTVSDISRVINRNKGHIRNVVHKFNSSGLIECLEPYSSGNTHNFAKYRVIK